MVGVAVEARAICAVPAHPKPTRELRAGAARDVLQDGAPHRPPRPRAAALDRDLDAVVLGAEPAEEAHPRARQRRAVGQPEPDGRPYHYVLGRALRVSGAGAVAGVHRRLVAEDP